MKIENVIKKFNNNLIYQCPKCKKNSKISDKSLICENFHVYDFSSKGYIHLIENYKGSNYKENLFDSRERVFKGGFYDHILSELKKELNGDVKNVLDVGCGEGFYIRNLKETFKNTYFFGLDNSKSAIHKAVINDKKNPYILANLSNLPFQDNSVDVILNILSPANYSEFKRILTNKGIVIKLIPTKNYLKEIREALEIKDYESKDTIDLLTKNMNIVRAKRISKVFNLKREQVKDFLLMTPLTFSKQIKEKYLDEIKKITIELDMIILKR